ncbi:MAG TPA: tetratricopeptide repeat protein [Methylocella sp.]|nr:tetratricopeptide repeat protein [Methylocella sp.]
MTDFFREVDEDVRRDRIIRIWTQYRLLFIGLAIAIVAGTAAWRSYEYYRDRAAEEASTKFEAAAQLARDAKPAEAAAAFEALSRTAPKGYAALSRLSAANEVATSDKQAAIKAYEALIEDPGFDPAFKDLAKLRAAMLRVDTDDPLEFEKRYAPLASDNFPYRHEIRELLGLAALKRNAFDSAGIWFDGIVSDLHAPGGVRMRAGALMGLVQSSLVPAPPPAKPSDGQAGNAEAGKDQTETVAAEKPSSTPTPMPVDAQAEKSSAAAPGGTAAQAAKGQPKKMQSGK